MGNALAIEGGGATGLPCCFATLTDLTQKTCDPHHGTRISHEGERSSSLTTQISTGMTYAMCELKKNAHHADTHVQEVQAIFRQFPSWGVRSNSFEPCVLFWTGCHDLNTRAGPKRLAQREVEKSVSLFLS